MVLTSTKKVPSRPLIFLAGPILKEKIKNMRVCAHFEMLISDPAASKMQGWRLSLAGVHTYTWVGVAGV